MHSKFEDIVAPVMAWLNRLHEPGGDAGHQAGIKFCSAMKSSYFGTGITGQQETIEELFAQIGASIGPSRAMIFDVCQHIFLASCSGSAELAKVFTQVRSQLPQQLGLPIDPSLTPMPTHQHIFLASVGGSVRPMSTSAQIRSRLPQQLTLPMAA